MKFKKGLFVFGLILVLFVSMGTSSCDDNDRSSDNKQRRQQEVLLDQGTAQVGMPAIKNFRERRLLKDILELRDQEGLTTYTYLFNQYTGKLIFFGITVGYGIPYATQFTNPQKTVTEYQSITTICQADPNGLFSPASAEGTWVLMKNPNGKEVVPVYIEPRIVVSPFILPQAEGNPR
ncbi:MAG: hypothetical protein WC503_04240 [Candidatus Shapirobacteria bacterium]